MVSLLHVMIAYNSMPEAVVVSVLRTVATRGLRDSRYGNFSQFCRWTCQCSTEADRLSLHLLRAPMARA